MGAGAGDRPRAAAPPGTAARTPVRDPPPSTSPTPSTPRRRSRPAPRVSGTGCTPAQDGPVDDDATVASTRVGSARPLADHGEPTTDAHAAGPRTERRPRPDDRRSRGHGAHVEDDAAAAAGCFRRTAPATDEPRPSTATLDHHDRRQSDAHDDLTTTSHSRRRSTTTTIAHHDLDDDDDPRRALRPAGSGRRRRRRRPWRYCARCWCWPAWSSASSSAASSCSDLIDPVVPGLHRPGERRGRDPGPATATRSATSPARWSTPASSPRSARSSTRPRPTPTPPASSPASTRCAQQMSGQAALDLMLDPAPGCSPGSPCPRGSPSTPILDRLAEETGLPIADLQAAAADPAALGLPAYANGMVEGFLFPATYDFEPDTTAGGDPARDGGPGHAGARPSCRSRPTSCSRCSPRPASCRRRPRSAEDMAKVARVLENRLADGMPLQLDTTVNYANGKSGITTTAEDRANPSPYNTYVHPGLPPGADQQPRRGGAARGAGAGRRRLAVLRGRRPRHRRDPLRGHRRGARSRTCCCSSSGCGSNPGDERDPA